MSVSIEVPHQCGFLIYANVTTYLLFLLLLIWYVMLMRRSRVVQAVALLPMCFGYVQATCPVENTFFGFGILLDIVIIVLLCLLKFKRVGLAVSFSTMLGRASAAGGSGAYADDFQLQVKAAMTMALALITVSGVTNYYNRRFFDYLERRKLLQEIPIEDRMSSFFLLGMEMTEELKSLMLVPWTLKSKMLEYLWRITGLHFAIPPDTVIYGSAVKEVVMNTIMPYEYERILFYLSFNSTLTVDGVSMTTMECPFTGIHPMGVICSHKTADHMTTLRYSMVDLEFTDKEFLKEAGEKVPEMITDGTTTKDDMYLNKRMVYTANDIEHKKATTAPFSSTEDIVSATRRAVQPLKGMRGGFKDLITGRWIFHVADDVKKKIQKAAARCIVLKKERIDHYKKDHNTEIVDDVVDDEVDVKLETNMETTHVYAGFFPPHFLGKDRAPVNVNERKYAIIKFWVAQDPNLEIFVIAGTTYYVPKNHQACLTPVNINTYLVLGNKLPDLKVIQRNVQPPVFYGNVQDTTAKINVVKNDEGKWMIEAEDVLQGAYAIIWYTNLETG